MTLTIEDVKKLTNDFKDSKAALQKQIQPVPDSADIYDVDRDCSYSVSSVIQGMNLSTMPAEAAAMHAKLLEDLNKFTAIVDGEISVISAHNDRVHNDVVALTRAFKASVDVPEIALTAALVINKKIVDEDDFPILLAAYREMGMTHFTTSHKTDVVYYDPQRFYYQTLKEKLVAITPYAFREKYPRLINHIQNSHVRTSPEEGDGLLKVMAARQA